MPAMPGSPFGDSGEGLEGASCVERWCFRGDDELLKDWCGLSMPPLRWPPKPLEGPEGCDAATDGEGPDDESEWLLPAAMGGCAAGWPLLRLLMTEFGGGL